MDLDLERKNEAIADAVFQQFPGRRERLRELEALLDGIPSRPPLPGAAEARSRARGVPPLPLGCREGQRGQEAPGCPAR